MPTEPTSAPTGPASVPAPAGATGSATRTMVVWVPDWPVTAAAAAAGHPPDAPVAVLLKGKVLASSAAARAEGVRRGLKARDAQARCPDLVVLKYDPVIDARAFDPVISCLEALTPGIQVIRPGMCALKARGPSRYYGSEPAAAEKLLDRLETFDVQGGRVGIADGPFAAEQAARAASEQTRVCVVPPGGSAEFLAPLTIDALERPELTDLLRRLGLRSLGAFAGLPATEVLTRFGPDGALAHRLARGDDDRPVVAREVPPELTRTLDFEPAVDRVDQVAFAVRTVADALIGRLTDLGLVCTTLRIEVGTESGRIHEREWLHPRWFSPADVVDRVRWQLQGTGTATSELTSPVVKLRLVPEQVDPVGAHVDGLWGGGPDERIHRALSRVQSMLGHGAVVTPVIGGGRGYADRQTLIPWGDRPIPTRSPHEPWPGALPAFGAAPAVSGTSNRWPTPAPTTIYPTPIPAVVVAPDGRQVSVSARGVLSGPPASFHLEPLPRTTTTSAATPDLFTSAPSPPPPISTPGRSATQSPTSPTAGSDLGPAPAVSAPGRGAALSSAPSAGGSGRSGSGTAVVPPGLAATLGEFVAEGNSVEIIAWAGPWPVDERWWDDETAHRAARFQFVTTDGRAWMFAIRNTTWYLEAGYD